MSGILGGLIGSFRSTSFAFELIQSVSLSATQSNVVFSSIPSNYRYLRIFTSTKGSATGPSYMLRMRFNGDSGSSYLFANMRYTNDRLVNASTAQNSIELPNAVPRSDTRTTIFGTAIIDIAEYASTTKRKSVRAIFGNRVTGDNSADNVIGQTAGTWSSTSAITSIDLFPQAGSWGVGSTFYLYGIKG